MKFRNLLFLALSLGLSACSADRSGEEISAKVASLETPASPEKPAAVHQGILEVSAEISALELAQSEIQPLLARVFASEKLRDPRYTSGEGRVDLQRLNLLLLEYARRLGGVKFAATPEAKRFREIMEEGCRPETVNFCKNLELLRLDGGTAAVVKHIALGERDIRSYYRMLRFAQSLTADRVTDPELDSLFVARSIELFKSYAKVKADSGTGRESLQIDHLSREQIDEL